jgi:hypothetical protein
MAGRTHSVLLAHGLKRLDEKKTYVLGFISVKQLQDPWKAFTKNMIRNLSEAQGSNVEIDMLISRSYGKSIEKTNWSGYETLGLQGSYLYPTVPKTNYYRIIKMIEDGIIAQNCVDVVYSSNKTAEDGNSIKIKRLYVGRIYDYDSAKDLVTLKMEDTYRSFKISNIDTMDEFHKTTKAEVRHLKLDLEPLSNGSVKVSWTEILGESNELIAKPWDGSVVKPSVPAASPKPVEAKLTAPKPTTTPTASKPRPKKRPFNHLGAETKLESLYNEFVTVVETSEDNDVRTSLKLKGFKLYGGSDKAVLLGEAGISVEVALTSTQIIRKKNSESMIF